MSKSPNTTHQDRKKCIQCELTKPITDFRCDLRSYGKITYRSKCKLCSRPVTKKQTNFAKRARPSKASKPKAAKKHCVTQKKCGDWSDSPADESDDFVTNGNETSDSSDESIGMTTDTDAELNPTPSSSAIKAVAIESVAVASKAVAREAVASKKSLDSDAKLLASLRSMVGDVDEMRAMHRNDVTLPDDDVMIADPYARGIKKFKGNNRWRAIHLVHQLTADEVRDIYGVSRATVNDWQNTVARLVELQNHGLNDKMRQLKFDPERAALDLDRPALWDKWKSMTVKDIDGDL